MIVSNTWLVLDCDYLCYRALYAFPKLALDGVGTGVIFGFMRDIVNLQETHNTSRFVFCFDHGQSVRCKLFPDYKFKRRFIGEEQNEEKELVLEGLRRQRIKLKKEYLSTIGYKNVCYQKGYEADDVIASVVQSIPSDDVAIIVSSDKDLYQLLGDNGFHSHREVVIWNPVKHKPYTVQSLAKEYGVAPIQWPYVKAIAGCSTDDIPGVPGVGEKTAAKFLRGEIKKGSETDKKITDWLEHGGWKRNLELVTLPYAGTRRFDLADDAFSADGWRQVCEENGLKSLIRSAPGIIGKRAEIKQGFLF